MIRWLGNGLGLRKDDKPFQFLFVAHCHVSKQILNFCSLHIVTFLTKYLPGCNCKQYSIRL